MTGYLGYRFSEMKLLNEDGSTFDNVIFSFKEYGVSQVLLPSRGISMEEWLMDSVPPSSLPYKQQRHHITCSKLKNNISPIVL